MRTGSAYREKWNRSCSWKDCGEKRKIGTQYKYINMNFILFQDKITRPNLKCQLIPFPSSGIVNLKGHNFRNELF